LQVCTHAENLRNIKPGRRSRTSHGGSVSWHKSNKRWQARVRIGGTQKHVGYFATCEEAAKANRVFVKSADSACARQRVL
jgi:hypothetical protein